MKTATNILDFIALIIQLLGTYIMFKNSPDNKPEGVVYLRQFGEVDFKKPKKKNLWLNNGFFILGLGFAVALISLILKMSIAE
jgi:hypothetical protein